MNIDDIRHNPAFPGGLKNIIVEFDDRLKALEAHAPMLAAAKPEWERRIAAEQAAAEQVTVEAPTHLRDEDVPTQPVTKRSGSR